MQRVETVMSNHLNRLDRLGRTFNTITGVICCLLLGILDLVTPDEYVFSFAYILPISFTTWLAGKRAGILIAIISAAFLSRNHINESLGAAVWNNLSTLGIFLVIIFMLLSIRGLLAVESSLSRIDPLTGVVNLRAFTELVEYEMLMQQRKRTSSSFAYIDIDNFKMVNDQFGHMKGDELLKAVATCLAQSLRKTDIIARVGGDEFIVFFPGTDQEAVKMVTQKVMKELSELSLSNHWPTTISMGVITCTSGALKIDDVISKADSLMYEVKKAGKNDVRYEMYP